MIQDARCRFGFHAYQPIVSVAVIKPTEAIPDCAFVSERTLDAYLAVRDASTRLEVQIVGQQCARCGKRRPG